MDLLLLLCEHLVMLYMMPQSTHRISLPLKNPTDKNDGWLTLGTYYVRDR